MTTSGNGHSGAASPASSGQTTGAGASQRFGVATPGSAPPAGTSRVRAGEEARQPAQPQGRWQRLARWQQVMVFVVAGALLIGGGFLIGWLTMAPDVRALKLVRGVPAAGRIGAEDLSVVAVRGDTGDLVKAADRGRVIGKRAKMDLPAGTLIESRVLTRQPPPQGGVAVPVPLKPGQLPGGGLVVGDVVRAVTSTSQSGSGAVNPRILVQSAPVWSVSVPEKGNTVTVTLMVDSSEATQLAAYSGSKPVSLILLGHQ